MDEAQFNRIYEAYSRKLYNYVLWVTRSRPMCEDILQSAFVKVWKYPMVPQVERELEALLFTVVRNTCMDHFRSNSRHARLRTEFSAESAHSHIDDSAENRMTWEMIAGLSEDDRTVIYLHLKMGYNYREVGRIMEMEENAVRVRAFRALKKLRDQFVEEPV